MKINYQLELDKQLEKLKEQGKRPSLLLHSCCGPCSSYVLEYLSRYFEIGLYYYNPNIWPPEEYEKRLSEQLRLIREMSFFGEVKPEAAAFEPEAFKAAVFGFESEPEGGARCERCFKLRLEETARAAAERGYDFFTTTLSVSPHKNAETLNAIGAEAGERFGVDYLYADFKKRDGYKRSIELSRAYSLYRQDYCGCVYSLRSGAIE